MGAVVARYAYDPFGKRTTVAGDTNATHHGFTGHEQLDEVGLVHMNGRVYDPVLGRFMSADPSIQAPGNGQSFNRYSYTMNNPLSFTDMSGYSWWTDFRDDYLKPVVAAVAAYYTFGYATILSGSYVVGGAAAGFVSGGITGGTVQSALSGAVSGAVFGGIGAAGLQGWQAVGANAVAGGTMSYATNGDFKSGFLSSGFSAFVDVKLGTFQETWHQALFKAVTGGTAARLGGGDFKVGAQTSGISAYVTGSLGQSNYDTEFGSRANAAEYMGADTMITMVRPLDNPIIHLLGDPMFLPSKGGWLEGSTFMLAHEEVFWTNNKGQLLDLGYSPNPTGVVGEGPPNNNMPFSSFRANSQRYGAPMELLVNAIPAPFNDGGSYRLLGTNCQVFAKDMRALTLPRD